MSVTYGGLVITNESDLVKRGLVLDMCGGQGIRIGDIFVILERAFNADGRPRGFRYRIVAERAVRIDRLGQRDVWDLLNIPEALRP